MSYTSRIKDDLLRKKLRNDCCRRAAAAAMLLFSRLLEGKHTYMTTNQALAQYIADSAASFFGLMMCVKTPRRADSDRARYTVCIPELDEDTAASITEQLLDIRKYSECDECAGSFFRGAFLISGFSYDPEETLCAEITVNDERCARLLCELLQRSDISCARSARRGVPVIKIKKKESLERFFALAGSAKTAMDVINAAISREINNHAQRTYNCDSANIERTLSAAAEQVKKIRAYAAKHSLESLPEDLREVARLRLEYPEMTLRELGESLPEPISRSGANHRLQKLIAYCEESLKKEKTNA